MPAVEYRRSKLEHNGKHIHAQQAHPERSYAPIIGLPLRTSMRTPEDEQVEEEICKSR